MLYYLILAVWHFRLKHLVLARGVKLFLAKLVEVVNSWTWIVGPRLVIMLVICLLKQSSVNFTQVKLVLRLLRMDLWDLGSVCRWPHLIKTSPGVSSGCQLPCGDTGSNCIRNNCVI